MAELRSIAAALPAPVAFRSTLGIEATTKVRQGQFAFSELVAWQRLISSNVRQPGFLSIDADEARNRVRITTTAGASREAFLKDIVALTSRSRLSCSTSPPGLCSPRAFKTESAQRAGDSMGER